MYKRIVFIANMYLAIADGTAIVLNRLVLFNVLDVETTTPIYYS